MNAIEVHGLHKVYRDRRARRVVAVDSLDFEVPVGGIFGFLGPNGAGKTTTIRCLLGLAVPTAGECRLLGERSPVGLPRVARRIGAVVDRPSLFDGFSGQRNLQLLAGLEGLGRSRIDAALERVGLAERAGSRVGSYSLGMRQRLALAAVLMKDPDLLILDEPANGLDPAGFREVRDLLRSLAAEGRTVFLSSHLLAEVQQLCDHVVIISHGRCLAQGSLAELVSRRGPASVVVRISAPRKAAKVLLDNGFHASVEHDRVIVPLGRRPAASVSRLLAEHGLHPAELRPVETSLEDVFLELTGEDETP